MAPAQKKGVPSSRAAFGNVRSFRQVSKHRAFVVEVRTINSRHFKLNLRVTDGYGALEAHAEAVIREYVKRGTIHCNLRIRHLGAADNYRLNLRRIPSRSTSGA